MKLLFLLPVFLAAVSLGRAQEEPSSADLFQQFLDVEAELKEQWKNDFEAFRQKKQDEQAKLQELIDAMNQKFKEQADKIKETYDQLQQAKEQREAEKAAHRQEVMDELKKAFQIFSDYKKEEKEREKQQTIDLYNELKKKWDEKVQEAAETKKQQLDDYKNSIDQMQTKWSDWVNKMNEAKKQAWDKQKQKLEQAKQEFEELKQLMEQELQRRTEAKQQRKEEHKKAIDQYRSDIQTKKDELDQLEAEAIEQMNTVQQKKNEITGLMMKIMNDQTKAYWDEKMYAKVQQNLDMAAAKEVFERNEPNWGSGKDKWGGAGGKWGGAGGKWEGAGGKGKGAGGKGEGAGGKWEGQDGLLDKIHKHGPSSVLDENKNKGKSTPAPPVAEMPTEDVQKVQPDYMESDNVVGGPEPRATLLDQITGTSQWQTVTWILLALSILLVIALIALIMYQIQQRKHYQELEGHNDPERAPLTRYPEGLQYSDVGVPLPKSILASNRAGTSRLAVVPSDGMAVLPVREDSMDPTI